MRQKLVFLDESLGEETMFLQRGLFLVAMSDDHDPSTSRGGVYSPLFKFEDIDGHLVRALSPLQASSFFRNLYESCCALRDNSGYLGLMDPTGPLGQSASIFGKDYPARRSIFLGAFPLSALILLLIGLSFGPRVFPPLPERNLVAMSKTILIAPYIPPQSKVLAKKAKGGGGGGERSPQPVSKGRLPRFAPRQFVPPAIVQSEPRLVMEPTLVGPSDIILPLVAINWGDPLAKMIAMSNGPGPGLGSGMGSGADGGIGSGSGPGYGAGSGGGINSGNGIVAGGGVIPPRATHRVSPQYTAEAFAAKTEGKVVLQVLVLSSGQAKVVRVVAGLPLGLTEKAIEAVEKWTFEAGRRNGQAIAMEAQVTIYFRR
ncbi:MAG: energy transducer TonB [bacterium]|nr:energy transducer TonB [bacterium]